MFPNQEFSRRRLLMSLAATSAGAIASQIPGHSVIASPESRILLAQGRVTLNGAGASFPAPLYQRWFQEYNRKFPNIEVNYQSVGSGAGRNQLIAGTVDFAASDSAMSDDEIGRVSRGVVMLPVTAGSVVVAYNLPNERSGIRLSRLAMANIFLGRITKWNDPLLAGLNPNVRLPDLPITVIFRSDSSGTTDTFTSHLNEALPSVWATAAGGPGRGSSINWPVGVGARGNEGVSQSLSQTPGSIGYTEFGFAVTNNLTVARLENRRGRFVTPDEKTAASALASVELPANLRAFVRDPAGENDYPIVTYTWILTYRTGYEPAKGRALRDVLNWALTEGQKFASELGYIPLPQAVVTKVQAAVNTIA